MKWIQFRIKTLTEAEDIIISSLYEIGLEGAQIEDKIPLTPLEKEQMFVDILPESEEDDGIAYLSFFLELTEDGQVILDGEKLSSQKVKERICAELSEIREFLEIGEGSVEILETEDLDWINNWKQYFHQFYIDDILVIPSWEQVSKEDSDRMVLHIDPGTAFGTGMHETTQLVIRQLRKYVKPGDALLDVGTGSGILGILALKFGVGSVVGTDLDPCCEPAVGDNCKNNGIDPKLFSLFIGNLITEEALREQVGYEAYEIVTANILADVLVPLTPVVVPHLKSGGIYITSGILREKEEVVAAAMREAGLRIVETTYQGEWMSITAMKDAK